MLIYNGQIIAGGGTIVLPMTRAEYEANKAILDSADVWVDLTDEPDDIATAEQIAYSVSGVQKSMGYIGDIATKAIAKVEPTDTALYLHEVGEYFINKDGDACKADLQIPVDGTITLGTNCHVLSKGVANDINSKLTDELLGSKTNLATNDTITLSEAINNLNELFIVVYSSGWSASVISGKVLVNVLNLLANGCSFYANDGTNTMVLNIKKLSSNALMVSKFIVSGSGWSSGSPFTIDVYGK